MVTGEESSRGAGEAKGELDRTEARLSLAIISSRRGTGILSSTNWPAPADFMVRPNAAAPFLSLARSRALNHKRYLPKAFWLCEKV